MHSIKNGIWLAALLLLTHCGQPSTQSSSGFLEGDLLTSVQQNPQVRGLFQASPLGKTNALNTYERNRGAVIGSSGGSTVTLNQFLAYFDPSSSAFASLDANGQSFILALLNLMKGTSVSSGGTPAPTPAPTLAPSAAPSAACGQILPGTRLNAVSVVRSCNGQYALYMQDDGNLVMYQGYQNGTVKFHSHTYNNPGAYAVMQTDGNLVVYGASGGALFQSGTYGHPGATLYVQDDGNLVIYAPNGGAALWNSFAAVAAETQAAQQQQQQQAASQCTKHVYVDFDFQNVWYNTSANPVVVTRASCQDAITIGCAQAVAGVNYYFSGNVKVAQLNCHNY